MNFDKVSAFATGNANADFWAAITQSASQLQMR